MNEKKQKVIPIIASIIVIAIIVIWNTGIYDKIIFKFRVWKEFDNLLEKFAEQGNSYNPVIIGENYLLNNIIYDKDTKTLIFEFQFTDYNIDSVENERDITRYTNTIYDVMLHNWNEDNQDIIILKNMNLIIEYKYYDVNNKIIFNQKMLYNTPLKFIE